MIVDGLMPIWRQCVWNHKVPLNEVDKRLVHIRNTEMQQRQPETLHVAWFIARTIEKSTALTMLLYFLLFYRAGIHFSFNDQSNPGNLIQTASPFHQKCLQCNWNPMKYSFPQFTALPSNLYTHWRMPRQRGCNQTKWILLNLNNNYQQ